MPPKKPPAATVLQKRCTEYLDKTSLSEWQFTDFWSGGEGVVLARYGDVWTRALQKIASSTDGDKDRRLAALAAIERYRNKEHLPESSSSKIRNRKGISKRLTRAQKSILSDPPPSYASSQEDTPSPKLSKPRVQHPSYESSKVDIPAAKPFNLQETQQHPYPGSSQGDPQENRSPGSSQVEISAARSHDPPEQEHPSSAPPPQEKVPIQKLLNAYEQKHWALQTGRKWYLSSGRCVEDVLFGEVMSQSNKARQLKQVPRESYANSYILDVDDPLIQNLFKPEWDEIVSLLLPLAPVDGSLVSFMHKFADVKTAADLRHRLTTTSYLPPGETYSSDKHGDQAWIHSALSSLVVLYEVGHMPPTENLEAWFQINVWGPIFDRCFQYIPKMSIARSESQSPCNSDRKNLAGARKPIGRKYDGLITHDDIEYGAVEDSKQLKGDEKSKKWTSDSLKLAKVLHDQMRGLEVEVNHNREALGKFQCVGFLTAGLNCQSLFLQYGSGYVSLLRRGAKRKVPKSVSPLSRFIAVLVVVWQIREAVRRSISNLEEFLGNTEILFREAVEQTVFIPAILPTCFDTDAEF